ncbi:hypothetical protein GCM10023192_76700 [Amycolatopsis samaneae]
MRRQGLEELAGSLRADAEASAVSRFVDLAERGRAGRAEVGRFLVAERAAQVSECTAFSLLASRFPDGAAARFFLGLASGVEGARARLTEAARSMDVTLAESPAGELGAEGHAFCGYLCWLALRASQAGAALAIYADFVAWCGACARVASALRTQGDSPDTVVNYFAGYAQVPEDLLGAAVAVARDGLDHGEDLARAEAEARLVLGYLRLFWDAAASPAG